MLVTKVHAALEVGLDLDALAAVIVDDGEVSEPTAIGQAVGDEVHAPAFVHVG